jgi:ppGpp synthetase/RelA/SpoT-type nucleotidyltranferase
MDTSPSKKQINKVGELLKNDKSLDKNSIKTLEYFRGVHRYPLHLFRNTIDRKLEKLKIPKSSYLVSQRLKRVSSIINKLNIQEKMKLSRMNDVAGLRIVVDSIREVRSLQEEFEKLNNHNKSCFSLSNIKDYIKDPKDSGYKGVHMIFKYDKNIPKESQCMIELQIRTKLQHSWATAVEVLDTYRRERLKQSQGNKKYLNLLKDISLSFSFFETGKIDEKLIESVIERSENIKLRKTLISLKIVTKHTQTKSGGYVLIESIFKENTVKITQYSNSKFDKANKKYLELELENIKNDDINVVLVSVKDIKKLKKSFPNYFLDTNDFLKNLDKIYKLNKELVKIKELEISNEEKSFFKEILSNTIRNN